MRMRNILCALLLAACSHTASNPATTPVAAPAAERFDEKVRLAAIVELRTTPEGTRVGLTNGTELVVARERVKSLKESLGLS